MDNVDSAQKFAFTLFAFKCDEVFFLILLLLCICLCVGAGTWTACLIECFSKELTLTLLSAVNDLVKFKWYSTSFKIQVN